MQKFIDINPHFFYAHSMVTLAKRRLVFFLEFSSSNRTLSALTVIAMRATTRKALGLLGAQNKPVTMAKLSNQSTGCQLIKTT
jgi:hypothetical protein